MHRFKSIWSGRDPVEEKYLVASKEHTVIYDYLEKFDTLIKEKTDAQAIRQLKELTIAFTEDLDQHFIMEEQVLFPAALFCLQSLDIYDLVLLLQKEHGTLERDFAEVSDLIQSLSIRQKKLPEELLTRMDRFFKTLERHARSEIVDLFKRMDTSRICKRLIKGITLPP